MLFYYYNFYDGITIGPLYAGMADPSLPVQHVVHNPKRQQLLLLQSLPSIIVVVYLYTIPEDVQKLAVNVPLI